MKEEKERINKGKKKPTEEKLGKRRREIMKTERKIR